MSRAAKQKKMRLAPSFLPGLLLAVLAPVALAQPAGTASAPLMPTGPVTISADRAEWQQGGAMLYSGNVSLVSDTLKLSGDRLELQQFTGGQYLAQVSGAPARLSHAAAPGADGKATPPVSAESAKLSYDSRTGVVDIVGGARLSRGADEITGNEIRYNALERRIQAAGGSGGQVKIVIQPPAEGDAPRKKKKKSP